MAKQRAGESSADMCRRLGWRRGTVLRGNEGYGASTILITAVGEDAVLARTIMVRGKPAAGYESSWTLQCRDWRRVPMPRRATR